MFAGRLQAVRVQQTLVLSAPHAVADHDLEAREGRPLARLLLLAVLGVPAEATRPRGLRLDFVDETQRALESGRHGVLPHHDDAEDDEVTDADHDDGQQDAVTGPGAHTARHSCCLCVCVCVRVCACVYV